MSSVDKILIAAVWDGSMKRVQAALGAGANMNGSTEQPVPPIVAATMAKYPAMVALLLGYGADPDRPVLTKALTCPRFGTSTTTAGERALHLAARGGIVEIVRLLLKRSRADPNATDNSGYTPLMTTCSCQYVCVEVVRLLLEAGADPALADKKDGFIPLHKVAQNDHMDLVDMLCSRAPATVNRCSTFGATPLFLACGQGHESMVSKLLSLGATQWTPLDGSNMLPLAVAAIGGFVGVVRVLLNEGGARAAQGGAEWATALCNAVRFRHARILLLLLSVDGEEGRLDLANFNIDGRRLLHYGAAYCYPAAVSILLGAGANEAARDSEGRIPRDVIGLDDETDTGVQMDRGKEVAVRRMLQRGPAYRARSWAWPSGEEAEPGGSGDGVTAVAAAAATAADDAAVLSSPPAMTPPPIMGVRIFRSNEKNRSKVSVRLVGRYCAKD